MNLPMSNVYAVSHVFVSNYVQVHNYIGISILRPFSVSEEILRVTTKKLGRAYLIFEFQDSTKRPQKMEQNKQAKIDCILGIYVDRE